MRQSVVMHDGDARTFELSRGSRGCRSTRVWFGVDMCYFMETEHTLAVHGSDKWFAITNMYTYDDGCIHPAF